MAATWRSVERRSTTFGLTNAWVSMHSWRIETSALLLHEAVDGSLNWGRRLESILASREGGSLGGTWLFASHESSLPPHQGYDDYLPNDTSGPQERWQQ